MATGFGMPQDANKNGTTPEDIQRIIAAEYQNAGIIDGGEVKGTANMSYTVAAGAVVLDTGPGMAIKVPIQATTVTTIAAPATGSRTDTIYVKQNFPASDGGSNAVVVGVTQGALPANSVLLQQFRVSAGQTATTAATAIGNRRFAVPTGGSRGRIFLSNNTIDGNGVATKNVWKRNAGTFFVPTDRDVELVLLSTITSCTSTGTSYPDGQRKGSVLYKFYVDDQFKFTWERTFDGFYETKYLANVVPVAEGSHTVHYTTEFRGGPTDMYFRFPQGGADKFLGDQFSVWDKGIIQGIVV